MVCTEASRLKETPPSFSPAWRTALDEEADPDLVPHLTRLAEADLPPPVFGFELCDARNVVVAEAEMAWPDQRVALVFSDVLAQTAPRWKEARWRVIELGRGTAWVDALLEDA